MRAINTLIIESISSEAFRETDFGVSGRRYMIRGVRSELQARLVIKCPSSNRSIKEFEFLAEGESMDTNEAMRMAVENFMIGKSDITMTYPSYAPKRDCEIDYTKVDNLIVQLDEPWKSMFEELFKNFNNPYQLELTKLNG